jgi:hypothetical protein
MRSRIVAFAALLALALSLITPRDVMAAKGAPGSPEFGYGLQVDLQGKLVPETLQSAALLQVDWVGLDFDWSAHAPDPKFAASLEDLDQVMRLAEQFHVTILLRLKHAPGWIMTSAGPDPFLTSEFIVMLANRYGGTLGAVEVFPGANTTRAWGISPDPAAYTRLMHAAHNSLIQAHQSLALVAGGLEIPEVGNTDFNLDDLAFLRGMYAAGAADFLPIISVQLPNLSGDPSQHPTLEENRVLRHYEAVHQVMLENQHESGLIWITTFEAPSGRIDLEDGFQWSEEAQSTWFVEAYQQLRAQLYIGAAFFSGKNVPAEFVSSNPGLTQDDPNYSPSLVLLEKLIAQNNRSQPRNATIYHRNLSSP